jgi:hypothetical protein
MCVRERRRNICVTSWPPCFQFVIKGRRSGSSVDVRRCWILIRAVLTTAGEATRQRADMDGRLGISPSSCFTPSLSLFITLLTLSILCEAAALPTPM